MSNAPHQEGSAGLPEDLSALEALENIVLGLFATGEVEQARELCSLWLDAVADQVAQGQPVPRYFDVLKEILIVLGDYEAVRARLQGATDLLRQAEDQEVALYWAMRGLCHIAQLAGRKTDSESLLREVVALSERFFGEASQESMDRTFELAGALAQNGRFEEALQLGHRLLEACKRTQNELTQANVTIEIALLHLLGKRDFMRAKEMLLDAEDLLGKAAPPGSTPGDRRERAETFIRNYLTFIFSMVRDIGKSGEDQPWEVFGQAMDRFPMDFELSDLIEFKLLMAQGTLQAHIGQDFYNPFPDSFLEDLMLDMMDELPNDRQNEWLRSLNPSQIPDEKPSSSDPPAKAEEILRRNLERRSSVLGEKHPDTAQARYELARHLYEQGNIEESERELRTAVGVWREGGGSDFHYTGSLQALAALCASTNREREAWQILGDVVAIEDFMISNTFSFASEDQKSTFLKDLEETYYQSLTVAAKLAASPEVTRNAFEMVLRRKALLGRSQSVQWTAALYEEHPEAEDIAELRQEIAGRLLAGETLAGSPEIEELIQRRERLEAELARKLASTSVPSVLDPVDVGDLARALPAGSALLEIIRCESVQGAFRRHTSWGSRHYLAFVLPAGDPDGLRLVDLGDARDIESAVYELWKAVSAWKESSREYRSRDTSPPTGERAAEILRERLLNPLLGALKDTKRLLISPDGDLNLLPFEILPWGTGGSLIDDHCISYLVSGRDVLRFGIPLSRQPAPPVVVAEPDYSLGEPSGGDPEQGFLPLAFAHAEGAKIAEFLGVTPWTGDEALESRLREVQSPGILHLATHGFLFDSDYGSGPPGRLSEQELWKQPLLQSGLALAGANTWLRGGQPPAEAGDGLLTAAEVATLDLADTELVVLSACMTGLGQVQPGEGVFGLRRSFALAGARTLVVSLWQVPDQETQDLMIAFYRYLLEGEGRAEALRHAQLDLKRRGLQPLAWGAFICQGDPGPLQIRPTSLHGPGSAGMP